MSQINIQWNISDVVKAERYWQRSVGGFKQHLWMTCTGLIRELRWKEKKRESVGCLSWGLNALRSCEEQAAQWEVNEALKDGSRRHRVQESGQSLGKGGSVCLWYRLWQMCPSTPHRIILQPAYPSGSPESHGFMKHNGLWKNVKMVVPCSRSLSVQAEFGEVEDLDFVFCRAPHVPSGNTLQ